MKRGAMNQNDRKKSKTNRMKNRIEYECVTLLFDVHLYCANVNTTAVATFSEIEWIPDQQTFKMRVPDYHQSIDSKFNAQAAISI